MLPKDGKNERARRDDKQRDLDNRIFQAPRQVLEKRVPGPVLKIDNEKFNQYLKRKIIGENWLHAQ